MKLYRDFISQEAIDSEYNIELAVGDMGPYVEWFVGGSARARAELACVLDVPFGPTRDETLDIFPASRPNAPVLLFVHGGYWRMLSSKEFSLVARGPVAHDVTVVISNYSLCPKVSIAEITRQSRATVALPFDQIGIELQFGLQPGMTERSQIKQTADRHPPFDDIGRQAVLVVPVGGSEHADLVPPRRMTSDKDAGWIAVISCDVMRQPRHCGPTLARDFSDADFWAQRII